MNRLAGVALPELPMALGAVAAPAVAPTNRRREKGDEPQDAANAPVFGVFFDIMT